MFVFVPARGKQANKETLGFMSIQWVSRNTGIVLPEMLCLRGAQLCISQKLNSSRDGRGNVILYQTFS